MPPSKSLTHRCLALALLAGRPAVVERPLLAEDTRLFLAALEAMGWGVEVDEGGAAQARLTPPEPPPDERREVEIFCGNAGTLFRFLTALLTVLPGRFRLDGTPRLRERPVGPLVDALRRLGAEIRCPRREGCAPLLITGASLRGGATTLDAGESSQYLSALLLAGQRAPEPLTLEVPALTSSPYVELTLEAVAARGGFAERLGETTFRARPARLAAGRQRVEGDYSAACYPAAAAALTGGEVVLAGLRRTSRQGDRRFFALLESLGARVEWGSGEEGEEVRVIGGGTLAAVEEDLSDMPDQVPTLAALAPFARGTTRITGVPHLRIKESDRLAAMARELGRLGAPVDERDDGLVIPGVWAEAPPPRDGVVVETWGDHRIAMSLALTALRRPGVAVAAPGVVAKSYPGFWRDLAGLLAG